MKRRVYPSSYTDLVALESLNEMAPKQKDKPLRSSPLVKGSKKVTGRKRFRAECDKIFEALDMAENLGAKIEAILKKLEKPCGRHRASTRCMRKWPTSKRR